MEETCQQVIGNCTHVFAYNAEINTFYKRLATMRKVAGGIVSNDTDNGMLYSNVKKFKFCSSDVKTCIKDEKLLKDLCYQITVGDSNPDVEGDSEVWVDGLKALRAIILGRSLKDGKRMLEEAKFDNWIKQVEDINRLIGKNQKLRDIEREMNDGSRFLVSKTTKKSSGSKSSASKSSSGSSGSGSGSKGGLTYGNLSMVFRKGVSLLSADYDSGATIFPTFDQAAAIQAGSGAAKSSATVYSIAMASLIGLITLFLRV
jgi:hypothetical protein